MKYIVIMGILGILLPIILPSPREHLVNFFGENNPLAYMFIVLSSFLIFVIIGFILQKIEKLIYRFKDKNQN